MPKTNRPATSTAGTTRYPALRPVVSRAMALPRAGVQQLQLQSRSARRFLSKP